MFTIQLTIADKLKLINSEPYSIICYPSYICGLVWDAHTEFWYVC
jgi:hypothetical protein